MMSTRAGTLVPESLTLLGHGAALLERDAAVGRGRVDHAAMLSAPGRELSREVYCLQGIQDVPVRLTGASRRLRTMFRLQGVGYLLSRAGA